MIKFEHTEVVGWEAAIRGMRNPMNSWEISDSGFDVRQSPLPVYERFGKTILGKEIDVPSNRNVKYFIGLNDLKLMKSLIKAGTDHRKFMRMLVVYVDITAPLYWWKEFDTYKVGTVANSCSTMHKVADKEFTLDDFSCEHLKPRSIDVLKNTIKELNTWRDIYNNGYPEEMGCPEILPKDKESWHQMIQLLPSSYNQKRTVMLNYEVLANIWKSRRNHKLDEWRAHYRTIENIDVTGVSLTTDGLEIEGVITKEKPMYFGFCDWIKTLPYSELITGDWEECTFFKPCTMCKYMGVSAGEEPCNRCFRSQDEYKPCYEPVKK